MRLFVAITLDQQVRSALARMRDRLKASCQGVRWVADHQLHLTVKFLGEVRDARVAEVTEAVQAAAARSAAFDVRIAGSGCFPPRGGVRVVWVGVEEPTGVLLQCVAAVEETLSAIGFAKERRPFSAHITLGRVREDRSGGRIRSVVEDCTYDSLSQSVESLTLMSSVLSPQGPTYTPVATPSLGRT